MDLEKLIIYSTFGASVVALILAVVVATQEKPADLTDTSGKIVPSKKMIGLCCIGLSFLLVVMPLLGHLLISPSSGLVIICVATCALLSLWVWTSVSPYYDVHWDDTQITGPSRFTLRPNRATKTQLGWDEVTRFYKDDRHGYCLEAADGRKIRWGALHGGNHVFRDHIRKRRPDLSL